MLSYLFNWALNPLMERRNRKIWKHYRAQGANVNRCGSAIAAMLVGAHHNTSVSVDDMAGKVPGKLFWHITDIQTAVASETVPVLGRAIKLTQPNLKILVDSVRYAVLHVDGFHFVIVRRVGSVYQCIDPLNGISTETFSDVFKRVTYNYIVTI